MTPSHAPPFLAEVDPHALQPGMSFSVEPGIYLKGVRGFRHCDAVLVAVWTRDIGRGKRMAHAIRAGHVSICTSGEDGADSGAMLGHAAQKASGFGAETGLER